MRPGSALRPIRRTLRFARSSHLLLWRSEDDAADDGDTAQRLRILVAVETPLPRPVASLSIAVLDSDTSW